MEYIELFVGIHLGLDILPDIWEKNIDGTEIAQQFFEDEKFLALYGYLIEAENKKKIRFQKEVQNIQNIEKIVVLYKNRSIVLTEENYLSAINVTSLQGSAVSSLYYTINNVFSPLLAQVNM